jgi:hypothetical protein
MKHFHDVRPKDDRSNDGRCDRGDEHRAGGDVLCVANQGMKIRRRGIGQKFKRGVDRFSRPDNRDGENNPAPFPPGDVEKESRAYDDRGGGEMDPGVVLATEHPQNPGEGVTEAPDPSRKFKRTIHLNLAGNRSAGFAPSEKRFIRQIFSSVLIWKRETDYPHLALSRPPLPQGEGRVRALPGSISFK